MREVNQIQNETNINQRGHTDRNLRNNQDFFMEREKNPQNNFTNNQNIINPPIQTHIPHNQSNSFFFYKF